MSQSLCVTEWLFVPKKMGSLGGQLTPITQHPATRETHRTLSPFHQARSVPHGKKKTVFDAWNGYHSVPLHPNDCHYTTFTTPWADISIALYLRDILLQGMATQGVMMKL